MKIFWKTVANVTNFLFPYGAALRESDNFDWTIKHTPRSHSSHITTTSDGRTHWARVSERANVPKSIWIATCAFVYASVGSMLVILSFQIDRFDEWKNGPQITKIETWFFRLTSNQRKKNTVFVVRTWFKHHSFGFV